MTNVSSVHESLFQMVDGRIVPLGNPGKCATCGAVSDRDYWVDTTVPYEFNGTVYICSTCITEIARVCGFISTARYDSQTAIILSLNEEIQELKAENAKLRDIASGRIRDLRSDLATLFPDDDSRDPITARKQSGVTASSEGTKGAAKGTAK